MQTRCLKDVDPDVFAAIQKEVARQQESIELIASENFTSPAVMEATGSLLTNKYAEGYPGKRYYGGCENVDVVEDLAIQRAKKIFGADHANVQPHSGSQANAAAYMALLETGDRILGMDINHGGHLTHGTKVNFSGKVYEAHAYKVHPETERIDLDQVRDLAKEVKPKAIVVGASAYPRIIDFKGFREIADEVGAYLIADIAHIAGLVAAGLHPDPVPYCDIVTTTTHKTMRGPRGGIILCKEEFAKKVNSAVFPGLQGGPLMHSIAGKAVALKEVMEQSFRDYQFQIIENAKVMARELTKRGYRLVSGGTDNHLMLVDLRGKNLTGKIAEKVVEKAGVTVNKNLIPYDPESPFVTSGIRLGSPAMTTRGFTESEMVEVIDILDQALSHPEDEAKLASLAQRSRELTARFPLYDAACSSCSCE